MKWVVQKNLSLIEKVSKMVVREFPYVFVHLRGYGLMYIQSPPYQKINSLLHKAWYEIRIFITC